eukprot:GHVS01051986.1.p1 GENE.GHVS01051986.1~~GHVS01051986.1.p1  ORF type:complete len:387 (+),score=98.18 GHVS01051986.1:486-1646(+)
MAIVNVTSVGIKNNPCKMKERIRLEIVFESLQPLKQDIDWKVLYCCCLDENNKPKFDPMATGVSPRSTSPSATAASESSASSSSASADASAAASSSSASADASAAESSASSTCSQDERHSSTSDKYFQDIELDSICLGPIPKGTLAFELETPPPNYANMSRRALFEMHALLLTGSYKDSEFIRIGWYVSHALDKSAELLAETADVLYDDSVPLDEDMVMRCILTEEPRITRYPSGWDVEEAEKQEEGESLENGKEGGDAGGEREGGGEGSLEEDGDGVGSSSTGGEEVVTQPQGGCFSAAGVDGGGDDLNGCNTIDNTNKGVVVGGGGGMECEMCTTTAESETGNPAFVCTTQKAGKIEPLLEQQGGILASATATAKEATSDVDMG